MKYLWKQSNLNILFMLNFQFLELGRDYRPSPVKQDPLSLGAAGIMAGTSLLGSLLGFGSQSSTNEMQAALMREQMDFQREENEKQRHENQLNRDWSEMMWNKENEYNTPSAMMARYKEAGLNPFLVGSDTGIGAAGSPTSPSMNGLVGQGSVPSLHAPVMDLNSPVQAFLQASAIDANNANQRSQQIKNVVDAAREVLRVGGVDAAQKILDTYLPAGSDVNSSPYMQQFRVEQAQREYEYEMFDFRSQIEQRFGYQKAERTMEILQRESDKLLSEIDKFKSDVQLNDASIKELLTRSAKNVAEKAHLNADTQTINSLRGALVDSAEFKADMDYFDEQEKSAEFDNRTGVRLYKRTNDAKERRLESETSMNPKYNKRAASIQRFRRALRGEEVK